MFGEEGLIVFTATSSPRSTVYAICKSCLLSTSGHAWLRVQRLQITCQKWCKLKRCFPLYRGSFAIPLHRTSSSGGK